MDGYVREKEPLEEAPDQGQTELIFIQLARPRPLHPTMSLCKLSSWNFKSSSGHLNIDHRIL